jgi:hypothetical protein
MKNSNKIYEIGKVSIFPIPVLASKTEINQKNKKIRKNTIITVEVIFFTLVFY